MWGLRRYLLRLGEGAELDFSIIPVCLDPLLNCFTTLILSSPILPSALLWVVPESQVNRSINLFFICFHWIPGICLVTGVGLFLWPGCSVSAETLLLLLHRRRCYVLNSLFPKTQSKPSVSKPGIMWALFQYFSISVSVLPGLPTKTLYEILHGWSRQNLACCSRNNTRQIIHSPFYLVDSTVFTACSLQLSAAERQQACWTEWP